MNESALKDHLQRLLEEIGRAPDFTPLEGMPGVETELKYASPDNFMGKDVYGPFQRAFLQAEAAAKLKEAARILGARHPGHRLRVYDALRPRTIQRVLWAFVEGTPQEGYVANPDRGSMHNYGLAVDLTVVDAAGRPLDMGTGFDAFTSVSEPRREEEYLASGMLKRSHLINRLILREAMTGAGFLQLPHEWWHYDAFPRAEAVTRFRLID